jgi:glutathione synthase/RimK-type ligase-like ATP-grasp enzyme
VIVEREILSAKKTGIGKFDVRVHIVGGKVVHLFVRYAGAQEIVTNWSQGGTVEHAYASILSPAQIISAIKVSEASAKALNSRFIGIDCMFDRDNPDQAIVVEAQCMCDFPKPEACNLGEVLVRYIIASHKKKTL